MVMAFGREFLQGGPQYLGGSGQGSMGGLQQLFSGLFSQSDKPYKEAGETLEDYLGQAKGYQQPFFDAGTQAIPQLQNWLKGMKDPSSFINTLMGKYQESPWAKYSQEQSLRSAQNMGSESGLTGSTPLMQFAQQNAHDISSQDMNQWLSKVLGINTEYGKGQESLVAGGQNAANSISELLKSFGGDIAKMNFGEESEKNQNRNNLFGGIFDIAKNGLFG